MQFVSDACSIAQQQYASMTNMVSNGCRQAGQGTVFFCGSLAINIQQMLATATVVGTMIWLCILQAKDNQGSLGSGHAGGLALQPQALI